MDKRWAKWLPAVVVPVVIGVGVIAAPLTAGAAVDLPDKTPAQVIALATDSSVTAFSGTVEQTSNLGLPDLSALGSSASGSSGDASSSDAVTSALDLVTGSHTARVFVDGAAARLQVLDSLAERDVVRTADDVWLYDSEKAAATHIALPADHDAKDARSDASAPQTPAELADRLLADIDPSTAVSVGTDASVAGRTVYELILTPRASDTLVGSVSIAVDSATGLPLSVQVLAKGASDPAFRLAFSSLSLDTPDASLFSFTPPSGTTVTEQALPEKREHASEDYASAEKPAGVTTVGSGWSTVVEIPAADVPADLADSPLLSTAAQKVDGGRVVSTTLLSVLFTDDGRVLAGAVNPQRLQDAAAGR